MTVSRTASFRRLSHRPLPLRWQAFSVVMDASYAVALVDPAPGGNTYTPGEPATFRCAAHSTGSYINYEEAHMNCELRQ